MEDEWRIIPKLPESLCEEFYVDVGRDVKLRILKWTPINCKTDNKNQLIMIPGWGSVFEGWRPLISEWASRRPIIYIETREKKSAIIHKKINKNDFQMSEHAKDLIAVIRFFELNMNEVDWFASSLGATILLEGFQKETIGGRSAILIGPNVNFKPPLWANLFLRFPVPKFIYPAFNKIVLFALEKRLKEEGQKIRYRRMFKAQDLLRMRLSAKYNIDYEMNLEFPENNISSAILSAESDKLHALDGVIEISKKLPNCKLISIPSNQYAHEAGVLKEIEEFHNTLS
jgi:pimeloyl-ACP methyl ester carboxylesterase